MSIIRKYTELSELINSGESVLIFGPRGSGKTFFIESLIRKFANFIIINLLESEQFIKYSKDPQRLSAEIKNILDRKKDVPLYCLIDEVQRVPALLNEIQRLIDLYQKQVVFVITGSSARKLKSVEANLLAGRAIKFDFYPFASDEIDLRSDENLNEVLKWGSLPKSYLSKNRVLKSAYLRTYASTYLEEEIQRESEIRNLGAFSRFLELAALENGHSINFAKIARAANLQAATVKNYFQILCDTLIATEIPAWSYKLKEQIQRSSKYYFFDNGVLNALTGNLGTELRESSFLYGALYENFIVNELIRTISRSNAGLKLFNYRNYNQNEIDLIVQKNPYSKPVAVEIKSSKDPDILPSHEVYKFAQKVKDAKVIVLCRTNTAFEREGVEFLPTFEGISRVIELAKDG
jgi:uncharacterized protein